MGYVPAASFSGTSLESSAQALEDSLGKSGEESGCEESGRFRSQSAGSNATCGSGSLAERTRRFLHGVSPRAGSACLVSPPKDRSHPSRGAARR